MTGLHPVRGKAVKKKNNKKRIKSKLYVEPQVAVVRNRTTEATVDTLATLIIRAEIQKEDLWLDSFSSFFSSLNVVF